MSIVTRGRIVRGEDGGRVKGAVPLFRGGPSAAQRTRMSQEEVSAHQNADVILNRALTQARAIVDGARADAARAAKEAASRAAEEEQARLAAAWLAMRSAEENRAARDLDRAIALARLLAERLIGHAVVADPSVIASLAKQAFAEARGARSARIDAHPLDAASLRDALGKTGLGGTEGVALEINDDDALARGSLRVHTDLGTLDARLTPRLERLAAALRDALRPA
jgi:flagellar biosynthesis/type III secretory pathway protein FliH